MIEGLIPLALQSGINYFDFWEMTLAEIMLVIKSHYEEEQRKQKNTTINNYNLATMVADFVGLSLNGKEKPNLYDIFPTLFKEECEEQQAERDKLAMALYREQMLDFAKYHNKQRKAGNIEK